MANAKRGADACFASCDFEEPTINASDTDTSTENAKQHDSLLFRVGLTMAGIIVLALLSMVDSLLIAESSKGDAAAINLAGSLRMQAYRIATRLPDPDSENHSAHMQAVEREIGEFEQRLAQLWQMSALSVAEGNPRSQALHALQTSWQNSLLPSLRISSATNAPSAAYLGQIDDFVDKINEFVKLLAQHAESKILLLRLVQGLALFMTLLLVLVAMHQLHMRVVAPLRDLMEMAHKARHGDLSVRVQHVDQDELGLLGQAFNLMAADLSTLYADLEARVAQQTQALRISNRCLELLYHTTRRLSATPLDASAYQALLMDIEKLTGLSAVRLCLLDAPNAHTAQAFSSCTYPALTCAGGECAACFGQGVTHALEHEPDIFSIPIADAQRQFGVLLVRHAGLQRPNAWQLPLLEAVAQHIASALQASEQAEQRARLALLEERNAIARDLHDSLAQSLSYLKIQVSCLDSALQPAALSGEARTSISELRNGLNDAYRQLRELIATFRLQIRHPRLEDSLRDMVEEFTRRSKDLAIQLEHSAWQCSLNPNQQIHVMQIIREALNNVLKHAQAQRVQISLRSPEGQAAQVVITDDGIGGADALEGEQHFGLAIMRERAKYLGGVLEIRSQPQCGTEVVLCFWPQ